MSLKGAARGVLHQMGGLAVLRLMQRGKVGVPMFHQFHDHTRDRVEQICHYISRSCEPVSLTAVVDALNGGQSLPANALAITVDDGYRNFLEHGHPIFRKYRIPTTIYAVAGFASGQLWLWTDRIAFAIEHTIKEGVRALGQEFEVSSAELKTRAAHHLCEALKVVPNQQRLKALDDLERSCEVSLPAMPPPARRSLSWDELRGLASEDVEIGCHTYSHPILSRIENAPELEHEIRGAKELMERNLGFKVKHFCYPNGRDIDIGDAAAACVRDAGYISAVACTFGLNTLHADPLRIRRLPFDSGMNFEYGKELLAGLHGCR